MVALSEDEALLGRLFQYRFHAGRGLDGHSFGNLFLAALTDITGDFAQAVRVSRKILAIRGRIFPSTNSNVTLVATLDGGRRVHGETSITASRKRIRDSRSRRETPARSPKQSKPSAKPTSSLLGPGSLYTSSSPIS